MASRLRLYIAIQPVPSPARCVRRSEAARCGRSIRYYPTRGIRPEIRCAVRVFAVYPLGEVQQQLVEDALKNRAVSHLAAFLFDFVDAPCGPRMHGRIQVSKAHSYAGSARSDACTIRAPSA